MHTRGEQMIVNDHSKSHWQRTSTASDCIILCTMTVPTVRSDDIGIYLVL